MLSFRLRTSVTKKGTLDVSDRTSMELTMQPPCGRNASPSILRTFGFVRGISNPCELYNKDRNIRSVVHGDDCASVGSVDGSNWMRIDLESKFDTKTTMVGHSEAPGVSKEGKILNRIIRATDKGWEYECDQRHVELLIEQLDLSAAKSLSNPGDEDTVDKAASVEQVAALLEGELASRCGATTYPLIGPMLNSV